MIQLCHRCIVRACLLKRFRARNRAIPLAEESQYRACGIEPLKSVIAVKEKRGKMPTICITQAPQFVVIFSKEERSVCVVRGVFVKELVHCAQEAPRLIPGDCTLTSQIRLKMGHQKGRSNSLP